MNLSVFVMTAVLFITLASPFGVFYGVKLARQKSYDRHRKIQNLIFLVCVLGVIALEALIKSSGGSGSIAKESVYYSTKFFRYTLFSHIVVAILSYLLWAFLILISNLKFKKSLPGSLSGFHRKMGYILFGGLVYTAITALIVYLMSLNLV